jgi:hypothetical protein
MLRNFFAFVGRLSIWRVLLLGLFSAVAIEAITVALRFGLDLQSTRDTGALAAYTLGIRIHHGYLGLLLAPVALCFRKPTTRNFLLVPALGLTLSDLFHHFLVLWPLTGSPQFHWVYPQ